MSNKNPKPKLIVKLIVPRWLRSKPGLYRSMDEEIRSGLYWSMYEEERIRASWKPKAPPITEEKFKIWKEAGGGRLLEILTEEEERRKVKRGLGNKDNLERWMEKNGVRQLKRSMEKKGMWKFAIRLATIRQWQREGVSEDEAREMWIERETRSAYLSAKAKNPNGDTWGMPPSEGRQCDISTSRAKNWL